MHRSCIGLLEKNMQAGSFCRCRKGSPFGQLVPDTRFTLRLETGGCSAPATPANITVADTAARDRPIRKIFMNFSPISPQMPIRNENQEDNPISQTQITRTICEFFF